MSKNNRESGGKIGIGVLGCGYWGPNLIRNFRTLPNASLRAVCDAQTTRLNHMKTLYPEVETFTDINQMLSNADLDAVVVATPVAHHYKLARTSLLAGKHTFIEKPMASSAAECEELIEIADRNGLVLMIGHTFIYSSAIKKISDIIRAGDIGEIRYINARRLNLGLFQKDINVAWDLAPHDISIILHILQDSPSEINCQGHSHVTKGVQDVTNMSLTFPNGRFATIQSSWIEPRKVREMTIVGTRRMIVYDDLQLREKIRVFDARVDHPPHYDTFAEFHYSYHYGDSYIPHIDQVEPLKTECQHFLDCIVNGTQPITCGRKGLELVRILEASSQSLENHGTPIPLVRQQDPSETKRQYLETMGGIARSLFESYPQRKAVTNADFETPHTRSRLLRKDPRAERLSRNAFHNNAELSADVDSK